MLKCFEVRGIHSLVGVSFDGVSDFAWQALMGLDNDVVAVLIHDSDQIVRERLQLFFDCVDFLLRLSSIVEGQEYAPPCHPVFLRVIALGEGPSFPPWGTVE